MTRTQQRKNLKNPNHPFPDKTINWNKWWIKESKSEFSHKRNFQKPPKPNFHTDVSHPICFIFTHFMEKALILHKLPSHYLSHFWIFLGFYLYYYFLYSKFDGPILEVMHQIGPLWLRAGEVESEVLHDVIWSPSIWMDLGLDGFWFGWIWNWMIFMDLDLDGFGFGWIRMDFVP